MTAHPIDLATWPRRDHFHLFRGLDFPYFSLTTDLDVTDWHQAAKAAGWPLYPTLVHAVTTAANAVEAFRWRIRGETVVCHDVLDPSFTVPWRDELFNFCTVRFVPELADFLARCLPAMANAETAEALNLADEGRDDLVYLSCLPWLSFSSMTHPVHPSAGDSVPRIAWGRIHKHDGRLILPINLQLHHGLADGRHVAQFMQALKKALAPRR